MVVNDFNSVDINLTGSYFIVPPPPSKDLEAFLVQNLLGQNIIIKCIDQTIWKIEKCIDGYVFGKSLTIIKLENGDTISSLNSVTGSIGSNGKVYFTFQSLEIESSNIMIGLGDFFYKNDLPQFYMQISTPFSFKWNDGLYSNTSFLHKSNMIKVPFNYVIDINGINQKVSDLFTV